MDAPRALGQAGRWAVAADAGLAALLAAIAWPFGGLRSVGLAQLASLVLTAAAGRRAWPWPAWSLALAGA